MVASSFIVRRGFVPSFEKALIGSKFWNNLFIKDLPNHHSLKIEDWNEKKRVITLYDKNMGKEVYHVKTQTIESITGSDIFEFRDETIVKGCVNMKIDAHWKISEKDGIIISCKINVDGGVISRMITPVVTRAVKKSLESIIDMDVSSFV